MSIPQSIWNSIVVGLWYNIVEAFLIHLCVGFEVQLDRMCIKVLVKVMRDRSFVCCEVKLRDYAA